MLFVVQLLGLPWFKVKKEHSIIFLRVSGPKMAQFLSFHLSKNFLDCLFDQFWIEVHQIDKDHLQDIFTFWPFHEVYFWYGNDKRSKFNHFLQFASIFSNFLCRFLCVFATSGVKFASFSNLLKFFSASPASGAF